MVSEFVLLHSKTKFGIELAHLPGAEHFIQWRTCLRRISIGMSQDIFESLPEGVDVFRGVHAYQFLLEVICGLHSPILGETEVFGQFKKDVMDIGVNQSKSVGTIGNVLRQINSDAKLIREKFLSGLGSQSYGSLTRREIGNCKNVHVLGAGQLSQEILPWLLKGERAVTVYGRCLKKMSSIQNSFSSAKIEKIENGIANEGPLAVVIAAPLTSEKIDHLLSEHKSKIIKIVDLRGESKVDPLPSYLPTVDLSQVFSQLEETRKGIDGAAQAALNEIQKRALAYALRVEHRPFGWEDVCA